MPDGFAAMIAKLSVSNVLATDEIQAIQNLPFREKELGVDETIFAEGGQSSECCLISEGFAFRSRTTADGARQIFSIQIPGEIPDLNSLHLRLMDHDLVALTPCKLRFVPHNAVRELTKARPAIANALWRETLIDAAIFREWVVNVGRRSGHARLSHLLLELYHRLAAVGRARDGAFQFPITQTQLADCVGLTSVHVNRVLQDLRKRGLVRVNRSDFHILKLRELTDVAEFTPAYLHQASSSS
jgi:CRP-like cAMP-binding protein